MFYVVGLQAFYDKGPHPFLLAASRASHGRITINRVPNCGIFSVYTVYICGCEPRNATWRAAGWRPILCGLVMIV
jgi:hypothetical protein